MTEPDAGTHRGDQPPARPVSAGRTRPGADAATSHAIAETKAQTAAANRVHAHGATERATPDHTGLVTRAIAFGIDALIINVVAAGVAAIVALALNLFQVPTKVDTALTAIGAVALVLWGASYFVTFWSTTGQTPGARMLRFRVLAPGADRGHIGPRRAVVRLVGMVLAAIPLLAGYFLVLFNDRRRGLHDYIAGTVVIDAPDSETPVRRRRARLRPPAT